MVRHSVTDIDAPDLVTVDSEATIAKAVERMFETGRPQLGVNEGDDLLGIVSHRDVSRVLYLCEQIQYEDSVLEQSVTMAVNRSYQKVRPEDSLFMLFEKLADSPYVIIDTGTSQKILRDVGLHQYLADEIEEFLLIEEIERTLRDIIRESVEDRLSSQLEETFTALDLRTPSRLEECSFRHYSIFISDNWESFESQFEHKQDFVRELIDRVGELRNQMFHFRELDEKETLDTEFIEFTREHLNYVHLERVAG
jgi:CBS domain-containing protein